MASAASAHGSAPHEHATLQPVHELLGRAERDRIEIYQTNGDFLEAQRSGVKNFKFADPIHHKDLFLSVEKKINTFNSNSLKKYEKLIKLYDRADIINDIA